MKEINISYGLPEFTKNETEAECNVSPVAGLLTSLRSPPTLPYMLSSPKPMTATAVSHIAIVTNVKPEEMALTNHLLAPILATVEAACRQRHINLFFANLPPDTETPFNKLPRLLTEQVAEGLLILGAHVNQATRHILQKQNTPLVFVEATAPDKQFDAVISDDKAGGYQAARYLILKKHRHIALVSSQPQQLSPIQARRAGYLQALEEAQRPSYFVNCPHQPEAAIPRLKAFLVAHPQVTAVVGANDTAALATMLAAKTLGKRLPQDLSLISCDNISLAEKWTPSLTTMYSDKREIGHAALQLLLHRIRQPQQEPVQLIMSPSLIERHSVAEWEGN